MGERHGFARLRCSDCADMEEIAIWKLNRREAMWTAGATVAGILGSSAEGRSAPRGSVLETFVTSPASSPLPRLAHGRPTLQWRAAFTSADSDGWR